MIEANAVGNLEVVRRIQGDTFVATRQRDGADDLEKLPRCRELFHTGFVHQIDKRRRTAIHNRHFCLVQLYECVVNLKADQRRQQVLNGFHRYGVTRQTGRVVHAVDVGHIGRDF